METTTSDYWITQEDLVAARETFERMESRHRFYLEAKQAVGRAIYSKMPRSIVQAISVLLRTWNHRYYMFHPFDENHLAEIDDLLRWYNQSLLICRQRDIEEMELYGERRLASMFADFEMTLGPVGAAKALHLLAPQFFPLWDRRIASASALPLRIRGANGDRYWNFMRRTRSQVERLRVEGVREDDLLKRIDEYNYCKYTKKWIG